MMTAAFIFGGQMAFAAIDPQVLADSYLANGYTFVEVKQGPTQTKLEALKGANVVEVVYDNGTGEIISQETQPADAEDLGRTGIKIKTTDKDFEITDDEGDNAEMDADDAEDEDISDDLTVMIKTVMIKMAIMMTTKVTTTKVTIPAATLMQTGTNNC